MGLYEEAQRAKADAEAQRTLKNSEAAEVLAAQKVQADADQQALSDFVKAIQRLRISSAKHRYVERTLAGAETKHTPVTGWAIMEQGGGTSPCRGFSCQFCLVVGVDGRAYRASQQPKSSLFGREPVPADLPIEGLRERLVQTLTFYMQ
jgi:hypothetical protein